jgi:LacI family gluconate utilization system Gnt-I transcriptional repressor
VLLCASDIFATGALLEAQSRGIAVPGRLAVTGFGDFELSRHITPAITTIQTPSTQIGRRAGELLLERIHDPSTPSAGVDLGWTLIARESA